MAARRVLFMGKRASLCIWAYALIELLHNISLLILYFQSYIMGTMILKSKTDKYKFFQNQNTEH